MNPTIRSRIRRLVATVVLAASVTGCAGTDRASSTDPDSVGSPAAVSQPPRATESPLGSQTIGRVTVSAIRITVDGQTVTAQLADNATARDLVDQLPLTLSFRDLNGVEKVAKLPLPLSTDGAPAGADPDVDDLGYYAPTGEVVLYYGDVGYHGGIVRIGRFGEGDLDVMKRRRDGFDVTIEAA